MRGDAAQSPQDIPGQQYGAVVAGHQLQQSLPTPQVDPGSVAPVAGQVPTPPPSQGQPAQPIGDPFAAAQSMPGPQPLFGASQRPDEPVTAGLTRGPGPGPEVVGIQSRTPLGDMLRMMSDVTRDPSFAAMAMRSKL